MARDCASLPAAAMKESVPEDIEYVVVGGWRSLR